MSQNYAAVNVHKAYSKRPDPDEPWRYACPECDSVRIHTNVRSGNGSLFKPDDATGRGLTGQTELVDKYRCDDCDASFGELALVDRKEADAS